MKLNKLFDLGLIGLIKTVYFNFSYFSFRDAIHLPVILSSRSTIKVSNKRRAEGLIITDKKSFGLIRIGFAGDAPFDRKVRTIIKIDGTLKFEGKAYLGRGTVIIVKKGGSFIWGNNSKTTGYSSWSVNDSISIGHNCLFSWDILFMDGDGHEIFDEDGKIINENKPIIIGNHVWIGCRCTILKGAVIPDNSIIGAGSLVTKSLETPNSIYFGQPIKLFKNDIHWTE